MDRQNKVDGSSRRKFIKIAVATAYVAPLIASMPAQASYRKSGSGYTPRGHSGRQSGYRQYRKYGKYRKYGRYRRLSQRSTYRRYRSYRSW